VTGETTGRRDAWGIYLLLIVALLPVINPAGPGRTALVDGVIVLGLGAFAATLMVRPQPVQIPFLLPVFLIGVGSVAAMVNAVSPGASLLAIAQDAYLFLWFIMLVHLLRPRDLTAMRVAWVVVGACVAAYGILVLMQESHLSLMDMAKPRGRRAVGTFYDPNMFGGYLVMSMFMALSLGSAIPRLLKWGAIGVMSMALIASKSNGALLSLIVGLPVWALVQARTRRISPAMLASGALLAGTLVIGAVWLNAGLGLGGRTLKALESESFLARANRSSEGRFAIWKQLQDTYARYPLGIGPGNSRWQSLTMEQRLRPASIAAREAHNDYLAYAIERGPLALLGLLMLVFQIVHKLVTASGKPGARPAGDPIGPLTAGLAGALAASLVHALTIEVLHFRHFWMLIAIVCAIEGVAADERREADRPTGDLLPSPGPGIAAA
jgi:O-antigen ligase